MTRERRQSPYTGPYLGEQNELVANQGDVGLDPIKIRLEVSEGHLLSIDICQVGLLRCKIRELAWIFRPR